MSENDVLETFETLSIKDDESEDDTDYYDDLDNDSDFAGFDNSVNKVVPVDDSTETILHWLTVGINPSSQQQSVTELVGNLNENGYPERLATGIISYILDCPNSKPELKQRTECVAAVMKAWSDSGPLVLNAINAALTAAEPLKLLQSRNLFDFINCCLDRKAFDGEKLQIGKTGPTSIDASFTVALRRRVYKKNKQGAGRGSEGGLQEDEPHAGNKVELIPMNVKVVHF